MHAVERDRSAGGADTWPTSGSRRRSTASSPRTATARSARSCWRWPTPRAGTPRTGRRCSASTAPPAGDPRCAAVVLAPAGPPVRLGLRPGAGAARRDAQPVRRPTPTRRRRWRRTSGCTPRSSAGSPSAAASRSPAPSGRRSSAPTTGWCRNLALVLGVAGSGVATTHRAADRPGGPAGRRAVDGRRRVHHACGRSASCWARPPWGPGTSSAYPHLDVDANELALVYRARGMSAEEAPAARGRAAARSWPAVDETGPDAEGHDVVGSGLVGRAVELQLLRDRCGWSRSCRSSSASPARSRSSSACRPRRCGADADRRDRRDALRQRRRSAGPCGSSASAPAPRR